MKRFTLILFFVIFPFLPGCENGLLTETVKYEVNCSPSGFDVTYTNSSGNTEQKEIQGSSWGKEIETKEDYVSILAQAANKDATITVKIYWGNSLSDEATSSGDYVVASASASLGG